MKFAVFAVICFTAFFFEHANAAPGLLQGSETAGTQHGLSLGGFNLVNIGGGYSKGGSIGTFGGSGNPSGAGAAAGGSTGFNFGLGPLQYNNQNSASAQTSYTN